MAFSKVILNGTTLMDVTSTTANASRVLNTYKATGADGVEFTGSYVPASPSLQAKTNISPTTSSQTIRPDSGYDGLSSVQINAMPSGTAGTPTASKGTVSNHSVSVTPTVTNTTGYITGGTKTGTAVTVSASELVSGSETKTENGTYDVTNLAEIVISVEGGGSSSVQVGTATATPSSASSSITFTGLSGNPTSFVVTSSSDIATNTNGVTAVVFDGTSLHGQTMTTQVEADTGFTKSYSGGSLTITASSASFQANAYKLVYTYGGSTSDIHTADVQVGSGATSITFSVSGRPVYWSCIFKSNFSTSSGYQRVIAVANDSSSTYGLAMDSVAHYATSWTSSYSGGNFTITSQGTNNGGYFHQPGYYQLTYYVDDSAPQYQSKTVTPTTSQQIVTPDSGYDALEQVTVNAIPSQYIIPSGNLPITANGNNINVSQYATVSVNVPSSGSSKNVQIAQGVNRVATTSYTAVSGQSLTVAKTGTYHVYWSGFRSSTSGTNGSQLYVGNTAYGSAQTTFSNHGQSVHLSNVSLTANQTISVYARARGTSYYMYVSNLTIIEQ